MICGISISGLGISIALIGICINLVFTKPYTGTSYYSDDTPNSILKRKIIWANVGNILIVLGTAAQLLSLVIKK